jgi:hypothetical protein
MSITSLSKYVFTTPIILGLSLATAQNVPTLSAGHLSAGSITLPQANPAEGYYAGTNSYGGNISIVVVESGEFWIVSRPTAERFEVIQGIGQASNGTFTSNNAAALGSGQAIPYALSATYVPKSALNGSLSGGVASMPVTFSAAYDRSYETSYPIATVAGRYNGVMQRQDQAQQFSMTVDKDGALRGSLSAGVQASPPCSFSGTAVRHSPLKNPYYVFIRFSGEPSCSFGTDNTATGVMTLTASPDTAASLTLVIVANNKERDSLLHVISTKDIVMRAPPAASDRFFGKYGLR